MIQPVGIEGGSAANDAVHLVAPGDQELSQVRTILPSDAADQSLFRQTAIHAKLLCRSFRILASNTRRPHLEMSYIIVLRRVLDGLMAFTGTKNR